MVENWVFKFSIFFPSAWKLRQDWESEKKVETTFSLEAKEEK